MTNRKITVVKPSQMFDSFMDEVFSAPVWGRDSSFASVDVNVKEMNDSVIVEAKMAGFTKDEVNIHVEDNILVIEAEKKVENEQSDENGSYHIREYSMQNVKRSVNLPSKVDGDKAEAEIKNGILKVKLPKLAEVMPKKIEIKAE